MRLDHMTIPTTSTLADLAAAVRMDTSMWKRRRDRIAQSLTDIARLLGRKPSDLPANPRLLLKRAELLVLRSANGMAAWDRLRPDLRAAAERWGLSEAPGRYAAPLTAEWRKTAARLADERTRLTLSRFMHLMSARGIRPSSVDESQFEAYGAITLAEGLVRRPGTDLRAVRVAWNLPVSTGPKRADVPLPRRTGVYAHEADSFPFAFRMELESYLAFRSRDVPSSGRTPLRPASVRSIRHSVMAFVSLLVLEGQAPESFDSLASIATPDMVRLALGTLAVRSGRSRTRQMTHLTSAVAAIARLWTGASGEDQAALDGLRAGFGWCHQGVSRKNRILVSQFDDGRRTASLLSLPGRLAALARAEPTGRRAARMFMTAVAVEMLIGAPLRPGEMLAIDIGTDVVIGPEGPESLLVTQHRYLSERRRRIPLGKACRLMMATYLREYRPLLVEEPSMALFPGGCHGSLGPGQLRTLVREWTLRLAGVEMTPTAFRHFAAKHYLERNPGDFGIVRMLLGHTSVTSTVNTYSRLDVAGVAGRVDAFLLQGAELPKIPPGRRHSKSRERQVAMSSGKRRKAAP